MKKLITLLVSCFVFTISFCQTDSTLKEYAGTFSFPAGSVITEISVIYENGSISISAPIGTSSLEKKEGDVFTITQFQGVATFTRDANKKIIGIVIDAMGYHLEGTKVNSINLAYNAVFTTPLYLKLINVYAKHLPLAVTNYKA